MMKRVLLAALLVVPGLIGCSGGADSEEPDVKAPPSDPPSVAAAGTAEDRGSPQSTAPPTN